jgi:hypothetical protein
MLRNLLKQNKGQTHPGVLVKSLLTHCKAKLEKPNSTFPSQFKKEQSLLGALDVSN